MSEVAIMDDYAYIALEVADWSPVKEKAEVTVFDRHLSEDDAVEALQSLTWFARSAQADRAAAEPEADRNWHGG